MYPESTPSPSAKPWWSWLRVRMITPLVWLLVSVVAFPHLRMGMQWVVRVVCLIPLVWCLIDLRWLARQIVRLWPAVPPLLARLEWPEKWRWRWEVWLVWLVVAISGAHLFLMIKAMTTYSMSVDEIGTIKLYSAHGPANVTTNYGLAKNHVFFNLVNSVLPGRDSLVPWRARGLSFLAVTCTWAGLIWVGWKRRRLYEAGLAAALIGLNQHLLEICLQARGYGFIFCFALIGALALNEYLRRGRYLWLLGLTVALGTYTLPSYLVFGGSLLLLLFLTVRRAEVFQCGVFTAGLVLFLYAPILWQLLHVASGYDESYGESYNSLDSVLRTLKYCIPPTLWKADETGFFACLSLLAIVPLLLRGVLRQEWKTIQLLLASTALFVTFCLYLKTPPSRVTAFLAAPILFSLGLMVGAVLRHPAVRWVQPLLATLVFGGLAWFGWVTTTGFEFLVPSRLSQTSQLAVNLTPAGGCIWVSSHINSVRAFVGKSYQVIEDNVPAARFAADQALLIDEHNLPEVSAVTEKIPAARMIALLKRKKISQRIWFIQPPASGLAACTIDGKPAAPVLTDRDPASGVSLPPGRPCRFDAQFAPGKIRSLNFWSPVGWGVPKIQITLTRANGQTRLIEDEDYLIEDKIISINLAGQSATRISVVITPADKPVQWTEVFAVSDP